MNKPVIIEDEALVAPVVVEDMASEGAMKAAIARVEEILAGGDPEPDDDEWLKRPVEPPPEQEAPAELSDTEKAFREESARLAAEAAAAARAAAATNTKTEQGGT